MSSNRPALAASRLACRRGDRLLFKGLDFELKPGQIVWLRGPNGSGKTSLLRLLAGLSTPAEGDVTWGGVPLREAGAGWHRSLCYPAHANALKDDLSVLESLQFLARLHGHAGSEAECGEALKRVGLFSRRHAAVRTLSQGQRRRVALARLQLDAAAPVWILDEPYDALDAEGTGMLDAALSAHAARGGSAVLTSHIDLTLHEPAPTVLQLDGYRVQ
ncbi:cytochrome c biogenesis heme-transporting ATPase CcmA [Piscinibacter aquaticus]|uniref:Cytochrome c biogenesis heme-transporting ATPase CcmA n=1 Tax=Piscinibacter aquaticus TaxID=392597 RepID=A0A5C6U057_9BURK|nr:cytochrome c biogenesis heme-transporting ATPase CcmA [Piscinibacter aquaticus]